MWAFYDGNDLQNNAARTNPTENVIQTSPEVYDSNSLLYLDQVIAEGKERGFVFILSLVNYWHELGGINQYNYWANENISGTQRPVGDDMQKFINGQDQQIWFKNYINMLLTRENQITHIDYRDEPAIMAWEICNEARNPEDAGSGNELRDWYQEISQYIKSIDSNHLVTTGEEGYDEGTPPEYSQSEYENRYPLRSNEGTSYLKNIKIPEIDFGTAHWYPLLMGQGNYVERFSDLWFEYVLRAQDAWIEDHYNIAQAEGKPFYLGEYGLDYFGNDHETVKNRMYLPLYRKIEDSGASGSLIWMLLGDNTKTHDGFGGFIIYPNGRRDEILFQDYQQHSFNMSETPVQLPPDVTDNSITIESVTANRIRISVNAAVGGDTFFYKLFYSTQNNLGSTPEDAESNGILGDEGTNKINLVALGLEAATQYWFTVVVQNTAGDKDVYETETTSTSAIDTTPPTIINDTLTTINVTGNSFTVNYIKATDADTPDNELVYKLFISRTGALDGTAESIEELGEIKDQGTDVDTLTARGLIHSTDYFFNIIVEDLSGNKEVYSGNSVKTIEQQGINTGHPMAQALVAYFQFNEGIGNIINDISNSVNAHNAKILGEGGEWSIIENETVWIKRSSRNEWLEIANHGDLNFNLNSEFTIGLFCAFEEDNSFWNQLFNKGHWPGYHISFAGWDDVLKIAFGSEVHEITINPNIKNNVNTLHSIILSVKAANGNADLYVNGVHVANLDLTSQKSTTTSGNSLTLPYPSTPETTQIHYNRFAIWRRALTAQEVAAWHNDKDLMLIGAPDQAPPELPNNSLSTSGVTDRTFTVNFEKAIDDASAPEELTYRLYISTSDNISTIQDAESNGMLQDTRSNTSFLQASNLNSENLYWFNVIVEDPSGNKAIYDSNSVTTLAASTTPSIDTSHSMAAGLLAYLQFDQGSGNIVNDISNSANLHNAEANGEGGQWNSINGEMVWSKRAGKDEWLEIADHNDLHFGTSSPFSVGIICSFGENNDHWNHIFHKGSYPGYMLSFPGWDDVIRINIGSESDEINISSGIKNDLLNLHSVVLVVTAPDDQADLYIDGTHVATSDLTAQESTTNRSIPLSLPNTSFFESSFEVHYNRFAVWGRALSAQEVADWHNDKDLMLTSTAEPDAPEVADGTLTPNDVAFTVHFQKATDASTPQADLVYKLYVSTSNALDGSVESIESMGTLQDTQTDVDQLTAVSLEPNTRYYFNVIVENLQGEKTAYTAGIIN